MTGSKKFIVAVIGCGRIGRFHIDTILNSCPHIQVKTVIDNNPDEKWLHSRGIFSSGRDVEIALQDDKIDAVLITTSSTAHVKLIKQAALAQKDIFCEKPVAFNLHEIEDAISTTNKTGVRLQVGFNRRFDHNHNCVREAIRSGDIGMPQIIKITNRDPKRPDIGFIPRSGGLFLDFNIHDFDMARFLTDDEVVEVFAMGATLVDQRIAEAGDIDTTIITLILKSGTYCVIDSTREAVYGHDQRIEAFGSLGQIQSHNTSPMSITLSTAKVVKSDKPHYSFVERYQQAFIDQIKTFSCVESPNDWKPAQGWDTHAAVAIALAAQKSYKENRPVKVSEIMESTATCRVA